MRKLRHKEGKYLAQGYTANKRQSWTSLVESKLLASRQYCLCSWAPAIYQGLFGGAEIDAGNRTEENPTRDGNSSFLVKVLCLKILYP